MSTDIEVAQVTNALAKFDKVGLGLAELEKAYKGVIYPVREKEGMKAAIAARRAIREPRLAVEKLRKEAKAPILALGRKLDSEAERITTILEALENPVALQIKTEEDRVHNEAVARETVERERIERFDALVDTILLMPHDALGLSSQQIQTVLTEARALVIDEEWQEFKDKAASAKIATIAALEGILSKAQAAEIEAARVLAERIELEKLRSELAARNAEIRKAQEADNARIASEQAVERLRLTAAQAEMDRLNLERQAQAQAVQDNLDADRKAFAAEQRERMRLDNINFRAHFDRMTLQQKEQLRALSDASPEIDVYALVMPIVEPEIVLMPSPIVPHIEDGYFLMPPDIERPTDAELVQCICERFSVEIDVADGWLREFGR